MSEANRASESASSVKKFSAHGARRAIRDRRGCRFFSIPLPDLGEGGESNASVRARLFLSFSPSASLEVKHLACVRARLSRATQDPYNRSLGL